MIQRLAFLALALPSTVMAERKVDFDRDVRPILAEKCFACHGPDNKARKADLKLHTRQGVLSVVDLKKPAESELLRRITTSDKDDHMPPMKSGKVLKPAQIETLKTWIAQGAVYEKHWAFIAPKRPQVPKAGERWARNAVDRFIAARLEKEGLAPSREADRPTLIRRVTFDLTGLPPTPKEVDDFVNDRSPDAYIKVVERLLDSIRYGERMALDWLDAARYADTNGYHIDNGRDMTRWREWVIDAVQQEHALRSNSPSSNWPATCFPDATLSQKIASGFNRNHMVNFEGGAIPAGVSQRLHRRSGQHDRHRLDGSDARLHAMPRSQVRPVHAEGVLSALRVLQQRARPGPGWQQRERGPVYQGAVARSSQAARGIAKADRRSGSEATRAASGRRWRASRMGEATRSCQNAMEIA